MNRRELIALLGSTSALSSPLLRPHGAEDADVVQTGCAPKKENPAGGTDGVFALSDGRGSGGLGGLRFFWWLLVGSVPSAPVAARRLPTFLGAGWICRKWLTIAAASLSVGNRHRSQQCRYCEQACDNPHNALLFDLGE
jgi:hypothetical protein